VLFMLSTSLTQDVYRRLFDPAAPDGRLLFAARTIAAVCGALAVVVAIVLPDVIGALAIFYTLLTATLVVPLLGGLWSARAGTREALAAMGAGTVATLAAHLTAAHLPQTLTASMLGIAAAGLAFLLALALRRPRHSAPS
jgi:SSS family solute:Na+ symporter